MNAARFSLVSKKDNKSITFKLQVQLDLYFMLYSFIYAFRIAKNPMPALLSCVIT